MLESTHAPQANYRILLVDDEPGIHTVTRLSLKGLRYRGRELEFITACSGNEAVDVLRSQPDIAVMLLDVVMETRSAGLDACRVIREQLGNHFVRILLHTGQPGSAPEKETIDQYDINGYLPKTEMTSNRLYAAVRTAIKAWEELVELDRHRRYLTAIHECVVSLHSFEPLDTTLQRILDAAVAICPTDLAVLRLETFDTSGDSRRFLLHVSTDADPVRAEALASDIAVNVARDSQVRSLAEASAFQTGFLVPLVLHRELGWGWIYLDRVAPDELVSKALPMLAAHAANALYSSVAESMLAAREGPVYDSMIA